MTAASEEKVNPVAPERLHQALGIYQSALVGALALVFVALQAAKVNLVNLDHAHQYLNASPSSDRR